MAALHTSQVDVRDSLHGGPHPYEYTNYINNRQTEKDSKT